MTNREAKAIETFKKQNLTGNDVAKLEAWIANAQRANAEELLTEVLKVYKQVPRKTRKKEYAAMTNNVVSEYSNDILDTEAEDFLESISANLPSYIVSASKTKAGVSMGKMSGTVFNRYISVSTKPMTDTIALRLVRDTEESAIYAVLTSAVDGVDDQIIKDYPVELLNQAADDFIAAAEKMFATI